MLNAATPSPRGATDDPRHPVNVALRPDATVRFLQQAHVSIRAMEGPRIPSTESFRDRGVTPLVPYALMAPLCSRTSWLREKMTLP